MKQQYEIDNVFINRVKEMERRQKRVGERERKTETYTPTSHWSIQYQWNKSNWNSIWFRFVRYLVVANGNCQTRMLISLIRVWQLQNHFCIKSTHKIGFIPFQNDQSKEVWKPNEKRKTHKPPSSRCTDSHC